MNHLIKKLIFCALVIAASVFRLSAQTQTIRGTVSEAGSGEPAIGAVVMIEGTSRAVITDLEGRYSIEAKSGETLVCSMLGFLNQSAVVADGKVIDFSLTPDTQALSEAVVVGYGTLKKTQLVGAVETLDAEALEGRANSDVTRSLQGQIPGLNIIQTDGKPSHSGNVYIRGNNTSYQSRISATNAESSSHSIGQGGSALVLIDGVEGSLSNVNPDDILSVSVLKDAASASVYGARGAYGVILVTTKAPADDVVKVNYNGSVSVKSRLVKWENELVTDGYTWAQCFVENFLGNDRVPGTTGTYPKDIAGAMDFSPEYMAELGRRAQAGYTDQVGMDNSGKYVYYGNTNWYKLIYRDANTATTHNLSVQGSSKKLSWMVSGRFYSQDSIYKIAKETFNNYNLRSKGKIQILPWLSLENNTSLYIENYHQPTLSSVGSATGNVYEAMERFGTPLALPYNPDGTFSRMAGSNGFMALADNRTYQEEKEQRINTTFTLNADIIKDVLKLKADYSYGVQNDHKTRVAVPLTTYLGPEQPYDSYMDGYMSQWKYYVYKNAANAVLTFTPKLGEAHDLNIMAGANLEKTSRRVLYVYMKEFLDPDYPNFSLMPADETNFPKIDENGSYDKGLVGFFARVNYTLLKRYIFEVAGRYDGSSLFPSNKRWGLFPSGSVGWRVSEEPFMEFSRNWLNNLKIRANMGTLGNAQISPYSFMRTYSTSKSSSLKNGSYFYYITAPGIVLDDVTWEKVTTYDIGFDADFLHNRLSLSGDYYVRNTTDLYIAGTELPAVLGTGTPKGNYGALQTKGWEFTIGWKDQRNLFGKPFGYNIKASLWDSRTWVTKYENLNGNFYSYYEGKELGEIWGFRTDGYFLTNSEANNWAIDTFHKNGALFRAYAGDLKFVDLNGDGKIDAGAGTLSDHGDMTVIGNATPRFQFGLNLAFNWNNIGLSIFLQGVGRRDWYPGVESGFFWGQYNRPYGYLMKTQYESMVHIDYDDPEWTVTNAADHPYWTRPVRYVANRNVGPLTMENDYYLQNAAYMRLKNLTLDYTIPEKITRKAGIEKLKIWVSGDNLLTFSPIYKHTRMFDPEAIAAGDSDFYSTGGLYGVGEGYSYPMQRIVTFGVNLTF